MANSVFPFTVYCNRRTGWGDSSLRDTFLAVKPKGMIWYGFDTIIRTRTDVEFVVFDMRDFVSGGLGDEIARLSAKVSADLTNSAVEERIRCLAVERREAELHDMEMAIIDGYVDEIRNSIGSLVGA